MPSVQSEKRGVVHACRSAEGYEIGARAVTKLGWFSMRFQHYGFARTLLLR